MLSTRKGEQVARQCGAALGSAQGCLQRSDGTIIARQTVLRQFEVPDHDGKQIVEIVCNAAR
jgi:hypothetical protein